MDIVYIMIAMRIIVFIDEKVSLLRVWAPGYYVDGGEGMWYGLKNLHQRDLCKSPAHWMLTKALRMQSKLTRYGDSLGSNAKDQQVVFAAAQVSSANWCEQGPQTKKGIL